MMNKNLALLVSSQVFGFTAATVTVFISGIIGAQLSPIKTLSTLPPSIYVIGTAAATMTAAKVMNIIGNIKGKNCLITDDIIDSGGTIVNAAKALKDKGAKDVYVYVTHGVLSGKAVDLINNSKIKKLIITDTIDNTSKIQKTPKIVVLSISKLIGEAIKRISNSTSVSDLFK